MIERLTVHTFDIENLGKFRPLWNVIRSSSVLPALYDHDEFVRHISQAHLKDLSDSLEALPTQEMIQIEKDVRLLELQNRNYPDAVVPYLSPKNGVVNLKLFMADETEYNFLSLSWKRYSVALSQPGDISYIHLAALSNGTQTLSTLKVGACILSM